MGNLEVAERDCEKCHQPFFSDAKFCGHCGHSQIEAATDQSTSRVVQQFATETAREIKKSTHEALKSDLGKKMAAGAAIGAVAAAAVPFVGWATGAVVGAGFIAYKRLTK
jgi:uncharacterized Zn finger protein (UPF0148 family)